MKDHMPFKGKIYILSLVVITITLLFLVRGTIFFANVQGVIFFLALTQFCELLPVDLPKDKGTITISFVVIYAAVLLLGPFAAAVVAMIGAIGLWELKRPVYNFIFNRAQFGLAASLAGLVYLSLGGYDRDFEIIGNLLPLLASGAIFIVTNVLAMVFFLALRGSVSPWLVWSTGGRQVIRNFFVFMPIGLLIAVTYDRVGPGAVGVMILPLLIARYAFKRFVDLQEAYVSTINALMAAVEAKDPQTRGHSERVAHWAVAIARKMGLPEEKVESIQYASLLHDVGKIGVPDVLLRFKGRVQSRDENFARHPVIGASILSQVRALRKAAVWVRHHHERVDGRGFPDGLKGEDIPLEARIMAVADAFDTMLAETAASSTGISWQQARCQVQAEAGSMFDPAVVKAFLAATQEEKPFFGLTIPGRSRLAPARKSPVSG